MDPGFQIYTLTGRIEVHVPLSHRSDLKQIDFAVPHYRGGEGCQESGRIAGWGEVREHLGSRPETFCIFTLSTHGFACLRAQRPDAAAAAATRICRFSWRSEFEAAGQAVYQCQYIIIIIWLLSKLSGSKI